MDSIVVGPEGNSLSFSIPGEINATLRTENGSPFLDCIGELCEDARNIFEAVKSDDAELLGSVKVPSGPSLGAIVVGVSLFTIIAALVIHHIRAYRSSDTSADAGNESSTDSDGSSDVESLEGNSLEDPLLSTPGMFPSHSHDPESSIAKNSKVPIHGKIVVPVLIVCTMGIFLSANTSVGAAVNFDATFFGIALGPFDVFNFSLVNTIRDMYDAKVYILAGLVAVWSGSWPYVKLILLLVSWFVPPTYFSKKARGSLLVVLDALGKWCMLDAFLMVMMSVAFKFNIVVFSKKVVAVNVNVDSAYGLYAFIIATILSLVLSHAVLAYHRNSISSRRYDVTSGTFRKFCVPCPQGSWFDVGSLKPNAIADKKEGLLKYLDHGETSIKTIAINIAVAVVLIACFLMILIGAYTDAFSFTFTGIAGKLIGIVAPEETVRKFSLITIAEALSKGDHSEADWMGIIFLQVIYLTFALIMPLILVIFLFALWFIPMSLRDQKIVFYVTEVVSAWNAVDVFIISILSSVVEINQFAQFLIGDRCDILEKILRQKCFGVTTEFLPGVWVIFGAALLLFCCSQIIRSMSERALELRETLALKGN